MGNPFEWFGLFFITGVIASAVVFGIAALLVLVVFRRQFLHLTWLAYPAPVLALALWLFRVGMSGRDSLENFAFVVLAWSLGCVPAAVLYYWRLNRLANTRSAPGG